MATGSGWRGRDPASTVRGSPAAPLRSRGGNRVHLGFDQVRKAHIRIVRQKRGGGAFGIAGVVEVDEVGLMAAGAKSLRGAQSVGDIPAEG